jgi:hypothetical protein
MCILRMNIQSHGHYAHGPNFGPWHATPAHGKIAACDSGAWKNRYMRLRRMEISLHVTPAHVLKYEKNRGRLSTRPRVEGVPGFFVHFFIY